MAAAPRPLRRLAVLGGQDLAEKLSEGEFEKILERKVRRDLL